MAREMIYYCDICNKRIEVVDNPKAVKNFRIELNFEGEALFTAPECCDACYNTLTRNIKVAIQQTIENLQKSEK